MNILKSFIKEEDGLSTIEISIILSVLIALGVIFRQQLTSLWNTVVEMISPDKLSNNIPTFNVDKK